MKVDWQPLRAELRGWRAAGRDLQIWWRDDDAVALTEGLEKLAALSEELSVPVHLAIVPAQAEASLSQLITASDLLVPLVHGWAHRNHAPAQAKKAEFGQPRETAAHELSEALARMQDLFGRELVPVFVPPWNRIDPVYHAVLAQAGYCGLSTFGARPMRQASAGVVRINTHIDPIDWKGTRGLIDPAILLQRLVAVLCARRQGQQDNDEPMGYLTHHLVHDADLWAFSRAVLSELLAAGATAPQLTDFLETQA